MRIKITYYLQHEEKQQILEKFSVRSLARYLNICPSYAFDILNGKRPIKKEWLQLLGVKYDTKTI